MKKLVYSLLILSSCVNRDLKNQVNNENKNVVEIDSISYLRMNLKVSKLDYYDTTSQITISDNELIDDFFDFLTLEVNDYNMFKLFYNEMTLSKDTIYILNKKQNFYRYLKKDVKTKLIFDSYIEDTHSIPKKLKFNILNLAEDRSKPLLISDSTFSRSLMINFKSDTIKSVIFVYYID